MTLFKKDKKIEGQDVLKHAEAELNLAIKNFSPNADPIFPAQAYFLLGEMYANAFTDVEKARKYYGKAVGLADHPGAAAALTKLDQNSVNP